jgi:hypothetical protein
VAFREVGEDFADRLDEEEIIAALVRLGLPPVTQDPPAPGQPRPGPRAVDVVTLPDYLRGGRSAVQALSARAPEARREAEAMTKVYDRFLAALAAHFHRPLALCLAASRANTAMAWRVIVPLSHVRPVPACPVQLGGSRFRRKRRRRRRHVANPGRTAPDPQVPPAGCDVRPRQPGLTGR